MKTMSLSKDYWAETISDAAQECGLMITEAQLECLAKSVELSHQNYGMAFYTPPASDQFSACEREHKAKLAQMEAEAEEYRRNAETAIKRALRQRSDACVSIGKYGWVFRHDGRSDQIQ